MIDLTHPLTPRAPAPAGSADTPPGKIEPSSTSMSRVTKHRPPGATCSSTAAGPRSRTTSGAMTSLPAASERSSAPREVRRPRIPTWTMRSTEWSAAMCGNAWAFV